MLPLELAGREFLEIQGRAGSLFLDPRHLPLDPDHNSLVNMADGRASGRRRLRNLWFPLDTWRPASVWWSSWVPSHVEQLQG